ncbi:hypothetical protein [Maritimibacter sp. HL-12]|uniref:hypothetical protein n=1 Tax=Maritimibacter sp. HL-12 TaxID=1162418 RepID=UPI000A1CE97A|nr:hypothetical protein [Maritimibacter sp. HL-12]
MTATFAALGVLVLPAIAGAFTPPEGCTSFLTVQNRSCSVTLQWRCSPEENSDFWSATFSSEGLESIVRYTDDYQWLDAVYMWDSSREEFAPPAADPISLTRLLDTGRDTFDFTMHRSQPDRSYDVRVVGADTLTGETVEIDGYSLDVVRTRVEITAEDGTVEYKSEGAQYLSRPLGQFFLGTERVFGTDGSVAEFDDAPVDIIEPGEPGFGATEPLYECNIQDAAMTPAAPTTAQKEITDDET